MRGGVSERCASMGTARASVAFSFRSPPQRPFVAPGGAGRQRERFGLRVALGGRRAIARARSGEPGLAAELGVRTAAIGFTQWRCCMGVPSAAGRWFPETRAELAQAPPDVKLFLAQRIGGAVPRFSQIEGARLLLPQGGRRCRLRQQTTDEGLVAASMPADNPQ